MDKLSKIQNLGGSDQDEGVEGLRARARVSVTGVGGNRPTSREQFGGKTHRSLALVSAFRSSSVLARPTPRPNPKPFPPLEDFWNQLRQQTYRKIAVGFQARKPASSLLEQQNLSIQTIRAVAVDDSLATGDGHGSRKRETHVARGNTAKRPPRLDGAGNDDALRKQCTLR